tara:strand:+ start:314 stop:844 length:531 start_codon:yes stop_codon:yes gene_type:complete
MAKQVAYATELKQYSNEELRDMFQDFNIENEEFVPLIYKGVDTGYQISKYGNLLGKTGLKLKWTKKDRSRRPEASVGIYSNESLTDDGYEYHGNGKRVNLYVHRLVALTFLTFPEHLPKEVKDDWDKMSPSTQTLIRDCLQVDHLDGNTFNPRWDNLEWVTPKENARRAVLSKNNS